MTESFRTADGRALTYRREGDGPVLVLHPGGYFICGPVCAADLAGGISGAETVIVPDCGHFSFFEAPARLRDEVTRFLA